MAVVAFETVLGSEGSGTFVEEARTGDVPGGLAAALDAAPGARDAFEAAAFSHRREWVTWVAEDKRPETRERRVRGVVEQALARG